MDDFYHISIPLTVGFILDSLLGDPLWLPHPIRWFGKLISFFELKLNRGSNPKLKGFFTAFILVSFTYLSFLGLIKISEISIYLYYTLSSILVFYGLANRSLINEALKVEHILNADGILAGRKQLSYIVGRDTSQLSQNQIRVAVLETLSENLSDGVIAPLFYYAIGGVPLMLTYKMINTLDSMVGYKNKRYANFGYASAKLDDIVNYIPARITALLMVIITFSYRGMKYIFIFGNKHSSPNAGYPESALAGILNCQFGGDNIYHGKLIKKPHIGFNLRVISRRDITKTCLINYFTSISFVVIIVYIICLT